MSDLTKTDVKTAVAEALEGSFPGLFDKSFEPFAKSIQKDVIDLRTEMTSEFAGVNQRLSNLKSDVKWMKENSSELFTKIDGFIVLYKSQEEQMTVFAKQMQRFEEKLSKLEIAPSH